MIDILVIGAGLSGLMAAYAAAKTGKKVKVIAKGLGALHWTAGSIDVFGYPPGERQNPIRRPLDYVAMNLPQLQPSSPYALAGAAALRAALDEFVALTLEIGLPYVGAPTAGDNLLLPTALGAARPTFLAPQAQFAGDLSRKDPMVIVGFTGLRDFYPTLIAENLARQGFAARAVSLPLAVLTGRRDSNAVQQAEGMDDKDRRARLAEEIKKIANAGERIGLPPILGMRDHRSVWLEMQDRTGAPVFEIPTLPPSVPGMRLFVALRDYLRRQGVRVEAGMEVIGSHVIPGPAGAAGQVDWVESATSSNPYRHKAGRFVLATGGVKGGGFNSDHSGRCWEAVFDLPLTVPQQRSQWFRPAFTAPEGHPIFTGGVRVDRDLQPLDADGRLLYHNLWAVGDVLAGDDTILQRSLEGTAIVTGMTAGRLAAGA